MTDNEQNKTPRRRLIRAGLVALVAYLFFSQVLLPIRVSGISMFPTYRSGRLNFCFRLRYIFSSPQRGDIVLIRGPAGRILYLKRVIGLAGDTVEFRNGKLHLNKSAYAEPYASEPCDWKLGPVEVRKGNVYVIGDNRSVSMHDHVFGQTPLERVMGGTLW